MKREVITTFDENDRKLLAEPLPDSPCDKCPASKDGTCCGCPDGNRYWEAVKAYTDADIYTIALAIKQRDNALRESEKLRREAASINAVLPDFVQIEL